MKNKKFILVGLIAISLGLYSIKTSYQSLIKDHFTMLSENVEHYIANVDSVKFKQSGFYLRSKIHTTYELYCVDLSNNRQVNRSLFTNRHELVNSISVVKAHDNHKSRAIITDYRGIKVLSYAEPFVLNGKKYAMIAEIDYREVFREFYPSLISSVLSALIIMYLFFVVSKHEPKECDNSMALMLRQVLKDHHTATLVTDGDGKVILVNAAFAKVTGWDEMYLNGKAIETILPMSQKEKHRQGFIDFMKSDEKDFVFVDVSFPHKRGKMLNISLGIKKITNKLTNKPFGVATIKEQ